MPDRVSKVEKLSASVIVLILRNHIRLDLHTATNDRLRRRPTFSLFGPLLEFGKQLGIGESRVFDDFCKAIAHFFWTERC